MTESSSGNFHQTANFQEFSPEITALWQESIGELSADVDLDATIASLAPCSNHRRSPVFFCCRVIDSLHKHHG